MKFCRWIQESHSLRNKAALYSGSTTFTAGLVADASSHQIDRNQWAHHYSWLLSNLETQRGKMSNWFKFSLPSQSTPNLTYRKPLGVSWSLVWDPVVHRNRKFRFGLVPLIDKYSFSSKRFNIFQPLHLTKEALTGAVYTFSWYFTLNLPQVLSAHSI